MGYELKHFRCLTGLALGLGGLVFANDIGATEERILPDFNTEEIFSAEDILPTATYVGLGGGFVGSLLMLGGVYSRIAFRNDDITSGMFKLGSNVLGYSMLATGSINTIDDLLLQAEPTTDQEYYFDVAALSSGIGGLLAASSIKKV